MNTKELTRKGKYMSMLLRHSPEKENLSMDEYGYVKVKDLCNALKISRSDLDWIVENNNKKRFTFGGGYQKDLIRATQGHSITIKYDLEPIEPPSLLFHGTSYDNKEVIEEEGLKKMQRHHVHLTDNLETAENVGLRYAKKKGKLWIITVEAKRMWEDGYDFYKTENGVWLTDHVPSVYFQRDKYYEKES
jgi:putative RNA 2'-phosphotransferase